MMRIAPNRSELYAFGLVLATLNALSQRSAVSLEKLGLTGSLFDLFGISVIFWFALYALVRLALDDEKGAPPRPGDWAVFAGLLSACFIPTHTIAAIALLGASAWLFATTSPDEQARRLAIVGLGLTTPLIWGPVLLRLLGEEVLAADAWFVSLLSGLPREGNVIQTPDADFGIVISQACSSLSNISQAILLVVTVTQLFSLRLERRTIGMATAGVCGMVLVNGIRLAAIGLYPEHFTVLHDGLGNVVFSWVSLLVLMAIVGYGVARAPRARV